MTLAEISSVLKLRGCEIYEVAESYCFTHPVGFEPGTATRSLLATTHAAADFGLKPADTLASERLAEPAATARRIVMALARELTMATWQNIADVFGLTHGAAMHAHKTALDQCSIDKAFAARVGTLRVACSAALVPDPDQPFL